MINNRQAGRRRGRNNPRQNQNGGGNRGNGGDSGNRIDNRARGNAAQLLEKYRNMARDAQLTGDRVNAEYYLQFADHYFRVMADNRARQEENQVRFRRFDENDQDDEFSESDDGFGDIPEISRAPQPREQNRRPERERRERPERVERPQRFADNEDAGDSEGSAPQREFVEVANDVAGDDGQQPPRTKERAPRTRRPRKDVIEETEATPAFDTAILPPSIGRSEDAENPEPAPRRPRRRSTAQAAE